MLEQCAASAVALLHRASVSVESCKLALAPAALQYRVSAAEETARLTIRDSLIDCPRVWDGDERPLAVEDCRNRVVFFSSSAEGKLVEDYSLCTYT